MKRSFCLVVIFLATQFLMAFLVTFVVNLPSLWRDGELNVSTLADNPSALGISMILTSIVVVAVMTALNWTESASEGLLGRCHIDDSGHLYG